ncbi:MAG: ABC transporter substrate-binding protein [Microbacteriaceae bacterium]|nr:MAG: ABC transporter substrate-binding protein [Microbacteriaceae bacterium]
MKRTKLTLIAGATTVLLGLAGCSTTGAEGNNSSAAEKVTIGISPFQDTYLPYIGQVKGWFKSAGLDVQLKSLAWNSVMTAVASGSVDMAVNNTTGVVSAANANPDVIYAYGWNPFTEGTALMIRPDGPLKTLDELKKNQSKAEAEKSVIEQLKGRTVVTTEGTDMGKALSIALSRNHIPESDVKVVDMDTDAGLAAFLSGTGDAYIGGIPERAKALSEGMKVGVAGPALAPPAINGIVTTKGYLAKNEKSVLKVINVMHRIIRYCDAKTDQCGTTITDQLNKTTAAGLTLDGFKQYWQKIELYAGDAKAAKQMILDPTGVAYWKTSWDSDNSYLVGTKAIPAAVPASSNFDMQRVWTAYVKEYGETEKGY